MHFQGFGLVAYPAYRASQDRPTPPPLQFLSTPAPKLPRRRIGMPVDRAYGSSIVGLAAPGTAEAIEIWRGASANRLGATLLGGAINFISPRAATTPGSELRLGGGSFGHGNIALPLVVDQVRPDQAAFIPGEECVLSGNRVWFLIATWFGKR